MQSEVSLEKDLYTRAQVLLATENPSNKISAMMLLHELVYSIKSDGSEDQRLWKGHAAIALADLYLVGVEGSPYVKDDGIYSNTYVRPDFLKAYDLYRRALKYECYDGVTCIADIYFLLGDTTNAIQWYRAAVEYGFKGAENAQKVLDELISSGRINKDEVPNHVPKPQYSPSFVFYTPPKK